MNNFDIVMQYLQSETKKGKLWIDLTPIFSESKLSFFDFNDILRILQEDEKYLQYDSSIVTTGLHPTKVIVGKFGDIKSIDFGDSYFFKFDAKLTLKGIKYQIEPI